VTEFCDYDKNITFETQIIIPTFLEDFIMSLFGAVRDHILIGGPNAIAGWGLLVLLVFSRGFIGGRLMSGLDPVLFALVLLAAAFTGNGVYALNAYYDVEADRINKPNRPIPSGRMSLEHALKYSFALMTIGFSISVVVTLWTGNLLMFIMWSIFTLLGIAYSKPPFKLKARHIFGNLCFAAFAIIAFAVGYLWTPITTSLILLAILYFLGAIFIAGIVTLKDFRDYEGDKASNDVTLPVKVGKVRAAIVSMVFIAMPIASYLFLWPISYPTTPLNIFTFFEKYWLYFLLLLQFGVYILLELVRPNSILSDPYSRIQYYFAIVLTAYLFMRIPFGLDRISWLKANEITIYYTVFVVVTAASLRLASKGYDVLSSLEKGRALKPR